jgi:hypothetical protein
VFPHWKAADKHGSSVIHGGLLGGNKLQLSKPDEASFCMMRSDVEECNLVVVPCNGLGLLLMIFGFRFGSFPAYPRAEFLLWYIDARALGFQGSH